MGYPRTWRGFVLAIVVGAPLLAQKADDLEFFEKKIRPVLSQKCYGCHSAESKPPQALMPSPHATRPIAMRARGRRHNGWVLTPTS